jgi:hypothetical protein
LTPEGLGHVDSFIDGNFFYGSKSWGMEWDSYELKRTGDKLQYRFDSEGPKGRIAKSVRFQYKPELGREVYNLAFGDYDERTDSIDDKIVSDNGDRERILYTIASAVIDFFKERPWGYIMIRGATRSRIRLYQIKINLFLSQIEVHYEVLGYYQGRWVPFEKGLNYEAFLVFKKNR